MTIMGKLDSIKEKFQTIFLKILDFKEQVDLFLYFLDQMKIKAKSLNFQDQHKHKDPLARFLQHYQDLLVHKNLLDFKFKMNHFPNRLDIKKQGHKIHKLQTIAKLEHKAYQDLRLNQPHRFQEQMPAEDMSINFRDLYNLKYRPDRFPVTLDQLILFDQPVAQLKQASTQINLKFCQ